MSIITSAEPPETATPVCCPGCGRIPTGSPLTCLWCYDPVPDCSDLELLHGHGIPAWNEAVQLWLDGRTGDQLRERAWSAAESYERGNAPGQRLERLLRDELTRRHNACEDTIPPSPGLPREERDTARPPAADGLLLDCLGITWGLK